MSSLTILKIGGSVITEKSVETPTVNRKALNRISKEIGEWYSPEKQAVIIHGAGSYGHVIVKKTSIHEGMKNFEQRIALAETQRLQNELNTIVCKALINEGVPAFPMQASASAVMENRRLKRMDHEVVGALVKEGIVPVLYGVPAYDKSQVCSILSGDQIAPYLATRLGAMRLVHGTNVNGVYTSDPRKNPGATHIPLVSPENWVEVQKMLGGSADTDVTGGMLGKVTEAYELARQGIPSVIVDVTVPWNLKKVLDGEKIGTLVK